MFQKKKFLLPDGIFRLQGVFKLDEAALLYHIAKRPTGPNMRIVDSLPQLRSILACELTYDSAQAKLFKADEANTSISTRTLFLFNNNLQIANSDGFTFDGLLDHPDVKRVLPGFSPEERRAFFI